MIKSLYIKINERMDKKDSDGFYLLIAPILPTLLINLYSEFYAKTFFLIYVIGLMIFRLFYWIVVKQRKPLVVNDLGIFCEAFNRSDVKLELIKTLQTALVGRQLSAANEDGNFSHWDRLVVDLEEILRKNS